MKSTSLCPPRSRGAHHLHAFFYSATKERRAWEEVDLVGKLVVEEDLAIARLRKEADLVVTLGEEAGGCGHCPLRTKQVRTHERSSSTNSRALEVGDQLEVSDHGYDKCRAPPTQLIMEGLGSILG
jgi:hypothetical protein